MVHEAFREEDYALGHNVGQIFTSPFQLHFSDMDAISARNIQIFLFHQATCAILMSIGEPAALKKSMKTSNKHRIFLVDDHAVVREGLARLINQESDLKVCGQAATVEQAIKDIGNLKPDLAIVDLSLSATSDGLKLMSHLAAQDGGLRMLTLSSHSEFLYAERALLAGARGYVMKQAPVECILHAIRQVSNGEIYLSAEMERHFSRRAVPSVRKQMASLPLRIGHTLTAMLVAICFSATLSGVCGHHRRRQEDAMQSPCFHHELMLDCSPLRP